MSSSYAVHIKESRADFHVLPCPPAHLIDAVHICGPFGAEATTRAFAQYNSELAQSHAGLKSTKHVKSSSPGFNSLKSKIFHQLVREWLKSLCQTFPNDTFEVVFDGPKRPLAKLAECQARDRQTMPLSVANRCKLPAWEEDSTDRSYPNGSRIYTAHDEADGTIRYHCRELQSRDKNLSSTEQAIKAACRVLHSNDSDLAAFAIPEEAGAIIRLSNEKHQTLDLTMLALLLPFTNQQEQATAWLAVGSDYTPGGVPQIGMGKVMSKEFEWLWGATSVDQIGPRFDLAVKAKKYRSVGKMLSAVEMRKALEVFVPALQAGLDVIFAETPVGYDRNAPPSFPCFDRSRASQYDQIPIPRSTTSGNVNLGVTISRYANPPRSTPAATLYNLASTNTTTPTQAHHPLPPALTSTAHHLSAPTLPAPTPPTFNNPLSDDVDLRTAPSPSSATSAHSPTSHHLSPTAEAFVPPSILHKLSHQKKKTRSSASQRVQKATSQLPMRQSSAMKEALEGAVLNVQPVLTQLERPPKTTTEEYDRRVKKGRATLEKRKEASRAKGKPTKEIRRLMRANRPDLEELNSSDEEELEGSLSGEESEENEKENKKKSSSSQGKDRKSKKAKTESSEKEDNKDEGDKKVNKKIRDLSQVLRTTTFTLSSDQSFRSTSKTLFLSSSFLSATSNKIPSTNSLPFDAVYLEGHPAFEDVTNLHVRVHKISLMTLVAGFESYFINVRLTLPQRYQKLCQSEDDLVIRIASFAQLLVKNKIEGWEKAAAKSAGIMKSDDTDEKEKLTERYSAWEEQFTRIGVFDARSCEVPTEFEEKAYLWEAMYAVTAKGTAAVRIFFEVSGVW